MTSGSGSASTYLVDASIFIFRAWHSLDLEFQDHHGRPTNAIYGYLRFLTRLLELEQPQRIAIAFDESLNSSFRNEIYPSYKANRPPAPDSLKRQFEVCRELTANLGLYALAHPRYEADDLIASLARAEQDAGRRVCIVTGDKDLAQILRPGDSFLDFGRRHLGYAEIEAQFGVAPERIADYLALTGDAVDNIPGVKGVGPKTATALLGHFGSLTELMKRTGEIEFLRMRGAKQLGQRLKDQQEDVWLARQLTGLKDDIALEPQRVVPRSPQQDAVNAALDEAGFGQAMREKLWFVRKRLLAP